jgi:hypothetical protein
MHELDKIEEAKFFYSQMIKEKENRDNLKYNLSAFLSSARSALQYALKEVETKNGGQIWYNTQIINSKVTKFFKDKRDINIHIEPVSIIKDINLKLSETMHISESVSIVIRDLDGNIKRQYSSSSEPPKIIYNELPIVEERYRFDDWTGDEDVFVLCQKYLDELNTIIMDGRSRGFLS